MEQPTQNADPAKAGGVTEADQAEAAGGQHADARQGQAGALEAVGQAVGRSFSSDEEMQAYLRNLTKLVGDNAVAEARRKAGLADSLIRRVAEENGMDERQAEEYVRSLTSTGKAQGGSRSGGIDPAIEERLRRGERAEFLLEQPDAKPYMDKVESYARSTGKTYQEAYGELYGDMVRSLKERDSAAVADKAKRDAQVLASSAGEPAPMPDEYRKEMDAYRRTGRSEHLQAAIKAKNKATFGIK
jgi:hypothetical protein